LYPHYACIMRYMTQIVSSLCMYNAIYDTSCVSSLCMYNVIYDTSCVSSLCMYNAIYDRSCILIIACIMWYMTHVVYPHYACRISCDKWRKCNFLCLRVANKKKINFPEYNEWPLDVAICIIFARAKLSIQSSFSFGKWDWPVRLF
jgi:hypothetical protein